MKEHGAVEQALTTRRWVATVPILFPIEPRVPPVSRTWRQVRNVIPNLCRVFLPIRYHGSGWNRGRLGLRASGVGHGPRNFFAITILAAGH